MLIFPQGAHTTIEHELADEPAVRFRAGVSHLAVALNVPVVPFGLAGSETVIPQSPDDFDGLKKLTRATKVPIGVDEAIHSFADIASSARAGASGVSLKLIKLGGITAAVEAGRLCQRLKLSVNIAAKIAESSISSAAALHLACAVPKADWGVSLTHFYLADDIVKRPLSLRNGMVALPSGSGLGIEVDEAKLRKYAL